MKKKRKKHVKREEPQTITKAVTHIRLEAANKGKLAALDQLAKEFLALAQQYVTLFCTEELPESFRAPCFPTPLSARWHRVAIQQADRIRGRSTVAFAITLSTLTSMPHTTLPHVCMMSHYAPARSEMRSKPCS
jgi:hypothetical protein